MAIFRNVNMSFWTDTKVVDNFTPEDKYFMLYCLTNNYTNIIGCYEISIKQMSNDLGYSKDTIEALLKRFNDVHKVISYDFSTKELYVKNWSKYNWSSSPKLDPSLLSAIEKVKSEKFKFELIELYNSRDTVSIPYEYPIDTTITNTISISNSNTNTISNSIEEILNYLNFRVGTKYTIKNKETQKNINGRLKDGYTIDDFKLVIDKMCDLWLGTEQEMYLRPSTLFRPTNFENYLNMNVTKKKKQNKDSYFKEDLAF